MCSQVVIICSMASRYVSAILALYHLASVRAAILEFRPHIVDIHHKAMLLYIYIIIIINQIYYYLIIIIIIT